MLIDDIFHDRNKLYPAPNIHLRHLQSRQDYLLRRQNPPPYANLS